MLQNRPDGDALGTDSLSAYHEIVPGLFLGAASPPTALYLSDSSKLEQEGMEPLMRAVQLVVRAGPHRSANEALLGVEEVALPARWSRAKYGGPGLGGRGHAGSTETLPTHPTTPVPSLHPCPSCPGYRPAMPWPHHALAPPCPGPTMPRCAQASRAALGLQVLRAAGPDAGGTRGL